MVRKNSRHYLETGNKGLAAGIITGTSIIIAIAISKPLIIFLIAPTLMYLFLKRIYDSVERSNDLEIFAVSVGYIIFWYLLMFYGYIGFFVEKLRESAESYAQN